METVIISYHQQLYAKPKQKLASKLKTLNYNGKYHSYKSNVYNNNTSNNNNIKSSSSSSSFWETTYTYNIDIMMTVLFVVSIVLSGNTAFAAQRETFKTKYPQSISHSVNIISNSISDGTGSSSSSSSRSSSSSDTGNQNIPSINKNVTNDNYNAGSMTINTTKGNSMRSLNTTLTSTARSSNGDNIVNTTTISTLQTSSSTVKSLTISSSVTSSQKTMNAMNLANNRNIIDINDNGPYFDKAASRNVTALLGKTAYLNCRVKNLGNKTMLLQVSWVRHRDIHLLTVGRYTYTSDQRFRAIHQPQTEDWMLQIKYPQHRDSGIYECQVSTTPHMSHYIYLNVVEPSTEIIGAPDLYIESGSTINLTCVILNSPEPPAYIFWNHNNAIINYDSPRGGVSVVTIKGETTTSFLLIKSARPSDSGHYQCNPSNAKSKGVTVHVLNGVSHSVSRGIPSSNAARGPSASSHVSKSIYLSVPVNVLIHLSVYHTIRKISICRRWWWWSTWWCYQIFYQMTIYLVCIMVDITTMAWAFFINILQIVWEIIRCHIKDIISLKHFIINYYCCSVQYNFMNVMMMMTMTIMEMMMDSTHLLQFSYCMRDIGMKMKISIHTKARAYAAMTKAQIIYNNLKANYCLYRWQKCQQQLKQKQQQQRQQQQQQQPKLQLHINWRHLKLLCHPKCVIR